MATSRTTLRVLGIPQFVNQDQFAGLFAQTGGLNARLVREANGIVGLVDYQSLLTAQSVKAQFSGWAGWGTPITVELQAVTGSAQAASYGRLTCAWRRLKTHECAEHDSCLLHPDPDSYGKLANGGGKLEGGRFTQGH